MKHSPPHLALLGLMVLMGTAPYLYAMQRLVGAPPVSPAHAPGVYVAPAGVLATGVR